MREFWQGVDDIPVGSPPMIGKRLDSEQWLNYVEQYDFGHIAPDRIVLHHTENPNEKTWRGLGSMEAMQRYYRVVKRWTSAPHIYCAPDGIWLFTPMDQVGIHAGRGNAGYRQGRLVWYSLGVEMVGSFDKERPSGTVWNYTKLVLGSLCRELDRRPQDAIDFHRDYTDEKSCPGGAVSHEWVWAEVNDWLLPVPKPWYVAVTSTTGLRIRQGRGTDFPVAGKLAFEERVLVDDDTVGWLHLADQRGFISKEFTRAD